MKYRLLSVWESKEDGVTISNSRKSSFYDDRKKMQQDWLILKSVLFKKLENKEIISFSITWEAIDDEVSCL